jgi:hypothetical protein
MAVAVTALFTMRARVVVGLATAAIVVAGLIAWRRGERGASSITMGGESDTPRAAQPRTSPSPPSRVGAAPPRFIGSSTSTPTAKRPVINETEKMIALHEAGLKRQREKFIATAGLDEKGAAKYDAIVATVNARFESDVLPLLEATFAERDPVKRKMLGERAHTDGLLPLVRAMRAEAEAALGPGAPFPLMVLDYPNHKSWGQWMTEFGKPVDPAMMQRVQAAVAERRKLAQAQQ